MIFLCQSALDQPLIGRKYCPQRLMKKAKASMKMVSNRLFKDFVESFIKTLFSFVDMNLFGIAKKIFRQKVSDYDNKTSKQLIDFSFT